MYKFYPEGFAESGANALRQAIIDINADYAVSTQGQIDALPNSMPVEGAKFAQCLGASGDYYSTPDSAAVSVTGDIDIRCKVSAHDWTPASSQAFVSKRSAGTGWMFYLNGGSDGKLVFVEGSNFDISTVAPSFTDGADYWVRVTRETDGTTTFYTSSNGATWTQLGDSVAGTAGALADTAHALEIGNDAGATLAGRVYRAQVLNGIDGTVVADFNPNDYREGSTLLSSATGELWTIQGNNYIVEPRTPTGTNRLRQDALAQFNASTDYYETPDNSQLGITGDIDIRSRIKWDDYTPASLNYILSKLANSGQYCFDHAINTTGFPQFRWSSNGTTTNSANATAAPPFSDGQIGWLRVTMDVDNGGGDSIVTFYTSEENVSASGAVTNWTQLGNTVAFGSTTSIFDGTDPLQISRSTFGMVGGLLRCEIYDGIDGTLVADFDPSQADGNDFTANTGEVWTANGQAYIEGENPLQVYADLPGANGDYFSTPDSVASSITGDMDIQCRAKSDDWSNGNQMFATKFLVAGDQRSFLFYIDTNGDLNFGIYTSGTATPTHLYTSSVAVDFANSQIGWVRVTFDADNGSSDSDVTFYVSFDNTNNPEEVVWVQLGAVQNSGSTESIYDSSTSLEIGSNNGGTGSIFNGGIYRVIIKNGIDGETVVDFDPEDRVLGSTFYSGTTGEEWTANGNAAIHDFNLNTIVGTAANLRVHPSGSMRVFGASGNYAQTPDSDSLSITGDIDLRVKVAMDDWTPGVNEPLIAKWVATGSNRSYQVMIETTGAIRFLTNSTGGGAGTTAHTSTVSTGFVDGSTHWIRATLDVDNGSGDSDATFYTSEDGETWVQLGDVVNSGGTLSIHDGTAAVQIGETASSLNCSLFRAQIYDGIDGTLVLDFDPTKHTDPDATVFNSHAYLDLPGASGDYASTPGSESFNSLGDFDIRGINVALDDWSPATYNVLLGKWAGSGNRSFVFYAARSGSSTPVLIVTNDGINGIVYEATQALSISDGEKISIRVTLDVDNGSSDSDCTFYYSTDEGTTWIQLGDVVNSGSTISIPDSAITAEIGSYNSGASEWLNGQVERVEFYRGINGTLVADFNPDNYDGTDVHGVKRLDLPGASGDYASSPDSVATSITGDIDIRVKAALTDWTPAAVNVLCAKFLTTGNQRSYILQVQTDGTLLFTNSANGSTAADNISTVATGFENGSVNWVRATLDVDNGSSENVVTFYTSLDGVTWTQLGDAVTNSGTTSIFDSTAVLEIGSRNTGTSFNATGTIYEAYIYNGIDGDLVSKYIATDQEDGATTVNGVMMGDCPGATGDYFSTPDSAVTSITGDLDIRAQIASPDWTPAGSNQSIVGKWNSTGNQRGYLFQLLATSGLLRFLSSSAGTGNTVDVVSTVAPTISDGGKLWVRVTFDVDNDASGNTVTFYTSADGVTWEQLGDPVVTASTTSIFDNTAPLEVGAHGAGASPFTGAVYRAQVYDGIDGNLVADFNPALWSSGTLTAATGEVWTANGNAAFTGQWTKQGNATFEEVYSLNGNAAVVGRFTLNGDTFIQNTGHQVAHSIGSVGIETSVGQTLINPFTSFTLARWDGTPSANAYAHDSKSEAAERYILGTQNSADDDFFLAQGGTNLSISSSFDNLPHLFTGQAFGNSNTKLTASGIRTETGDAGSQDWDFATLFADRSGTSTMQGYIGRMTVFDESLETFEINRIQAVLQNSFGI